MSTPSTRQHVLLKDINPMIRQADIEVITLQQEGETVITREGATIRRFLVADLSGVMILSVWGTLGDYIQTGDILRVTDVHGRIRAGQFQLSTSKLGKIIRLGQDTFPFAEAPNFSLVAPGANIPPSRLARMTGAAASSTQAAQSGPTEQSYASTKKQPFPTSGPVAAINQQQQGHHYSQSPRNSGHKRPNGGWRGGGDRQRNFGRGDNRRQIPSPAITSTQTPTPPPPSMGVTKSGGSAASYRDPRKRHWEQ
ncbi:hypothetical protein [Absidia glauca]|uniref:OB domain-containing protein n=1 Tax=Absidia glauca TaxID=4829 RepID=A0A168RL51_ABSGL|nr:hypothetical protein [Absidia glauca]